MWNRIQNNGSQGMIRDLIIAITTVNSGLMDKSLQEYCISVFSFITEI